MEGGSDFRAWNELIPDTLGLIFSNLEAQEILQVIALVCKSWCRVVEGPYCWQRIDTGPFLNGIVEKEEVKVEFDALVKEMKVEQVLRALIPRSSGSLRELCVSRIDDHMLSFIADYSAGSLQTLELTDSGITDSGFELFLKTSTSLTSLVIRSCNEITMPSLDAIKRNCKRLVSLSWDFCSPQVFKKPSEDEVESIMPNLKRLSLQYAMMDDSSILWLLSCCPVLEWVQIRAAFELELDPRVVKEKFPNIVTLNISDESGSYSDWYSDDYGSYESEYDEYYASDDNLHWNYEYDEDDYLSYNYE